VAKKEKVKATYVEQMRRRGARGREGRGRGGLGETRMKGSRYIQSQRCGESDDNIEIRGQCGVRREGSRRAQSRKGKGKTK
jgi:hypothetical protein